LNCSGTTKAAPVGVGLEARQILFGSRKALSAVAAFSGLLNVLMLAPALYMLQVYDRVLNSKNETTLLVLTLLVLGVYALSSALDAIRTWVLVRVTARFDTGLRTRVFEATFAQNLLASGSSSSQPIEDMNAVRQVLAGPPVLAVLDAPWLPVYLAVIALLSVELAVFTAAGACLLILLAMLNERVAVAPLVDAQRHHLHAQATLTEFFRGAQTIEAMGMIGGFRQRWYDWHVRHLGKQSQASDRAAVLASVTKFVRMSMQSLALGFGAWLVLEDRLTPGGMIAVSVLVSRALSPAEMLIANWRHIVMGRDAFARLEAVLSSFPQRQPALRLPAPRGGVHLENVSAFAPESRRPILEGINLTINAGDSVGIIGPSGCGKSTLARLLVGARNPDEGTVRLDGADLQQWDKTQLGPSFGYLPQEVDLFDGTVAENIARFGGGESASVIAAARLAGIHEAILGMPKGYETRVGSAGRALSGGQRQRIGLARALFGQPVLVVLDEPNSNLDDQGERGLVETVRALTASGVTVAVVTHRFSTLAAVNKLIVLHDGQLKAYGARDSVLAAMGVVGSGPTAANTASARDAARHDRG
jgi:ATP-binding cassette subfamily C exporter for protease/lipase